MLFPEYSVCSPDRRGASLDIGNEKANNIDIWIESFDSNARFLLDFSGWTIGTDSNPNDSQKPRLDEGIAGALGCASPKRAERHRRGECVTHPLT